MTTMINWWLLRKQSLDSIDKVQARWEGGYGGELPRPRDVWGGALPSVKNIKYTGMRYFKNNSKIFSPEGPARMFSRRGFDIPNMVYPWSRRGWTSAQWRDSAVSSSSSARIKRRGCGFAAGGSDAAVLVGGSGSSADCCRCTLQIHRHHSDTVSLTAVYCMS